MTRIVARHSNMARCGREIFTEALLLATDFFVHYLRIFRAKETCLLLETDGERRVLVQKLYRRLAHTRAIE